MNETSGEWAFDVNKFDQAGVTPAVSIDAPPPRVAEAPIALERRGTQIVPVITTTHTRIPERVSRFHSSSDLLRFELLARLSGDEYAAPARVFEMQRPQ